MITQEVFDKSVFGIRKQGGPSIKGGFSPYCVYRGGGPNKDRKCAAGQILPDEEYRPEFENMACHIIPFFGNDTTSQLVSILQRVHDHAALALVGGPSGIARVRSDAEFFVLWEPAIKKFAADNDLIYTPPTG